MGLKRFPMTILIPNLTTLYKKRGACSYPRLKKFSGGKGAICHATVPISIHKIASLPVKSYTAVFLFHLGWARQRHWHYQYVLMVRFLFKLQSLSFLF